jgi:hypothetical protein
MPRVKHITYSKRLKKCMRGRPPKEVAMDPQQEQINIPDSMRLTQRPVCNQRTDERPMLRTEDGHVLAVVETWRPDSAPN